MRFLAHIVMRPNDGKPQFTVETEFDSANWPSAYDHCMGLGTKFNAVVLSHRLRQVGTDNTQTGEAPPALPAPEKAPEVPMLGMRVAIAFPAPSPWPAEATLTG